MLRFFASSVLTVIVLTIGTTLGRASDLRDAIELAQVIRTFDLEDATVTRAISARGVIVFQLQKSDSSIVAAYTNFGDMRFWYSSPSRGRPVILLEDVSSDGSTVTLARDIGQYEWEHLAVDGNGTELCTFPVESPMQSSPTGQYFCPIPETEPLFEVFDRSGRRVKVDAPSSHVWSATFVTDSLIGYTSPLSGYGGTFIRVPVMQVPDSDLSSIDSVPRLIQTKPIGTPCKPVATVSHRDGMSVFALLADGPHTWAESGQLAFASDCGDWVATVGDNLSDSSGYLHIASTKDRSVSAETRYTGVFLRGVTCGWCQDAASLAGGVVSVLHSWAWSTWDPEYTRYETLFADFDTEALTISEPLVVHGIYIKARGDSLPGDTYLRVCPPDTVQLIRLNR